MNMKSFILFFSSLVFISFAQANNQEFEELYENFRTAPNAHNAWLVKQTTLSSIKMRKLSDKALIFSLWDQVFEQENKDIRNSAILSISQLRTETLEDILFVRAIALKNSLGLSLNRYELNKLFEREEWSDEALLTFETLTEYFEGLDLFSNKISRKEQRRLEFLKEASSKDEWADWQLKDLLNFSPNWRRSMRTYKEGSKLFLFCRHNREFPCLMVMKDSKGNWVKEDGKIWTQQKLALSRKGIPSHKVNGHTPQGVYTIDSVMPSTDQRLIFGKFRRLILNFIEKDWNDKTMMSLMPESTQDLAWWKAGTIARDVGRSLLRIHGTGVKNLNASSNWYPFYPTAGCIASKENKYNGVEYTDQRQLLDTMMNSMGLSVRYSNEKRLKGLLYVVNINDAEGAVKFEEIESLF